MSDSTSRGRVGSVIVAASMTMLACAGASRGAPRAFEAARWIDHRPIDPLGGADVALVIHDGGRVELFDQGSRQHGDRTMVWILAYEGSITQAGESWAIQLTDAGGWHCSDTMDGVDRACPPPYERLTLHCVEEGAGWRCAPSDEWWDGWIGTPFPWRFDRAPAG